MGKKIIWWHNMRTNSTEMGEHTSKQKQLDARETHRKSNHVHAHRTDFYVLSFTRIFSRSRRFQTLTQNRFYHTTTVTSTKRLRACRWPPSRVAQTSDSMETHALSLPKEYYSIEMTISISIFRFIWISSEVFEFISNIQIIR